PDRPGDRELTDALRRSLAAQAREAPDGADLAERIVAGAAPATAHRSPDRQRSGRLLPLVAAAAVIALIAGIVGIVVVAHRSGSALASADCLRTTRRCTALLRTTDGLSWKSHPNTPFNVPGVQGCAAPCVRGIRFATDRVGYAFGPGAFFMTTDGAQSWRRLD